MHSTEFGQLLRLFREHIGLTQAQVGDLVGIKREAVARHEAGLVPQNTETLIRYAQTLKCRIIYSAKGLSIESEYQSIAAN